MKQDFVLTLGEVIEQARLGETVGLEVMPYLVAKVALVKVYMKDAYSGDSRSPIPMISVHSVGDLLYRRQS